MSITVVKAAFDKALARKATCASATMQYVDGGRRQLVTFVLTNGEAVEFEASAHDDLQALAREAGENYQQEG